MSPADRAAARDYPICLRLAGRPVLVAGGGPVAAGRVAGLLEAGALVTVFAPVLVAELEALGGIKVRRRAIEAGDLEGTGLLFLALDDVASSSRIAALARARGWLVNAADLPDLCDFTLPAVGRRGVVTIAVSTAGHAPSVARRLRTLLLAALPPRHVELLRLVTHLRRRLPAGSARMAFVRGVIDGEVGDALLRGERKAAFVRLRAALALRPSGPA